MKSYKTTRYKPWDGRIALAAAALALLLAMLLTGVCWLAGRSGPGFQPLAQMSKSEFHSAVAGKPEIGETDALSAEEAPGAPTVQVQNTGATRPGGGQGGSSSQTQPEAPAPQPSQEPAPSQGEGVLLAVSNLLQAPQLPNGCEITSATMVLNYLGYRVDKVTMAESYLPTQTPYYRTDPETAYMGDPASNGGWYCYTGPVVEAVNEYFYDIGESERRAVDISGAGLDELKEYVSQGHPVIFWATVGFQNIQRYTGFTLPNGEYPYSVLHVMVLRGFDGDTLYINDPMGYRTEVSAQRFEEIYTAMGLRAVVIV